MKRSSFVGRTAFTLLVITGLAGTLAAALLTEGEGEKGKTARLGVQTAEASTPAALSVLENALLATTQSSAAAAAEAAAQAAACRTGAGALEPAREHLYYQRYQEADLLLSTLLEQDCLSDPLHRNQARFQQAYLLTLLERHEEVLLLLDAIEGESPIDDYIAWLRGLSLDELGRHSEAADAFRTIFDESTSPLHWRARAREAKSLVAAERWEEALPVLEEVLELFPDYPRRHLAMHALGLALEALERPEEAARAHQEAALEFPYRLEGQASERRVEALREAGIDITPLSPQRRFEQYRQLSIDKFWPLAHEKLTALREEIRTPDGVSELENQILLQLAMNAFQGHRIEDSLEYFAEAREIFEAGHEGGFNRRTLYRNYSFALGRLRRLDESLELMEAFHANSPRRTRLTEIGNFYTRYGLYEEAYQTFDQLYTAAQKRQWDFSYLMYKTGRFEEAADNLNRLANRSRGKTRAQYLYWAARSLERDGRDDEALPLYAEIRQSHGRTYYGIQASSRLKDMEQRLGSDSSIIAQSGSILNAADQALDAFDLPPDFQPSQGDAAPADLRAMPLAVLPSEDDSDAALQGDALRLFLERYCSEEEGRCTARQMEMPLIAFAMDGAGDTGARSDPFEDESALEGVSEEAESAANLSLEHRRGPDVPRIRYSSEARIHWDGRYDSPISFANYSRGSMIGPLPDVWSAYDDETHIGGLKRAVEEAGDLFPSLERAYWLWLANWNTEARREIRHVSLEFRSLSSRSRALRNPHALPHGRWEYFIDNRRRNQRAQFWGMSSSERRFPIPDDRAQRQALLERQQQIFDRRQQIRPMIVEAMQEVGDYHLVRRQALGDTWWLRHPPEGDARRFWSMAYPRAFPEKVIPLAKKHNINPYMIWALMLVESSFNPDSLSIANAKGLLQVIPRTGLKIAELFGSDDFGPFDLLEEDHSIEQGIFYFSRLVQKFHGQELLAFAGYNGGPHRVGSWLDHRGFNMPHDEFIEEIPFNESRGYAKKVLRFLHIYLQIYEGYDDELYVGQNLRLDYLEQPDF